MSGAATCAASLAPAGVGAIRTAGAYGADAAEAAAGVTVVAAGVAAMVDGGSKLGHELYASNEPTDEAAVALPARPGGRCRRGGRSDGRARG